MVFCEEGISIWAIPSLLPYSLDHFLDDNPTHLPPSFRIPFPHDSIFNSISNRKTTSSWYWDSIYFDILHRNSKVHRFKLIVKPDLSDASLHIINTSDFTPPHCDYVSLRNYRICEDNLVCFWTRFENNERRVFTGLTSAHFPEYVHIRHWMSRDGRSLCPASGRFVHFDFLYGLYIYGTISVVDLI